MNTSEIHNPCPDCWQGWTWARAWVGTIAYRLGMLNKSAKDTSVVDFPTMHPWLRDDPYPPERSAWALAGLRRAGVDAALTSPPGEDIVPLVDGLHQLAQEGISVGYDHILERAIIRAAGLDPDTWGICQRCAGTAVLD